MLRGCSWETELSKALRAGHWPQGCDPELRSHVETCRSCGDLALVTQAFQQARSQSISNVALAHPGLLWWRAQLRRQREVAGRIVRPVAIAQIFAWAVSVLVAIGFLLSQYRSGLRWVTWSELDVSRTIQAWAHAAGAMQWGFLLTIPVFGILVLLGWVALSLWRERD